MVAASLAAGQEKSTGADTSAAATRFDAVVKQAGLTSAKLARLFDRSSEGKSFRLPADVGVPAPERFASLPADSASQPLTLLAYADLSSTLGS